MTAGPDRRGDRTDVDRSTIVDQARCFAGRAHILPDRGISRRRSKRVGARRSGGREYGDIAAVVDHRAARAIGIHVLDDVAVGIGIGRSTATGGDGIGNRRNVDRAGVGQVGHRIAGRSRLLKDRRGRGRRGGCRTDTGIGYERVGAERERAIVDQADRRIVHRAQCKCAEAAGGAGGTGAGECRLAEAAMDSGVSVNIANRVGRCRNRDRAAVVERHERVATGRLCRLTDRRLDRRTRGRDPRAVGRCDRGDVDRTAVVHRHRGVTAVGVRRLADRAADRSAGVGLISESGRGARDDAAIDRRSGESSHVDRDRTRVDHGRRSVAVLGEGFLFNDRVGLSTGVPKAHRYC